VFYRDGTGVYRARAFDGIRWLTHGFGTRDAATPEGLATLHQIHSSIVIAADGCAGHIGEGDALTASQPGATVAVKTADCVPLLLVDERKRRVAAVHAGWRGTLAAIAQAAIRALEADPADVRAAIGPAIGPCCFEVGPEVAREFQAIFPERADLDARTTLDLVEANRRLLIAAGIGPERIHCANLCTRCRDEFHSFRRDRERAGRMYSWIGIRE
jgi:polyphenol oxidase